MNLYVSKHTNILGEGVSRLTDKVFCTAQGEEVAQPDNLTEESFRFIQINIWTAD